MQKNSMNTWFWPTGKYENILKAMAAYRYPEKL